MSRLPWRLMSDAQREQEYADWCAERSEDESPRLYPRSVVDHSEEREEAEWDDCECGRRLCRGRCGGDAA